MSNDRHIALYIRVSTGYQADRDSLPFQKKELRAYCKHVLHREDVEIFEDAGRSAKNTDRPAFARMMDALRAGLISHVVVYKIDRISRDLVDFSMMYKDFKRYRVTFISLNEQFDTSSAIGEAVLKIILVFAELERKLTSERVTDIMIGRALEGKWNGARMPFGWRWNADKKMPEHDPAEAEAARTLYRVYDETRSTSKVRDYCYDNGIQTKRGGKWTTATICNFLRNPMNKGDYRYNYRESARGGKKDASEVVYLPGVFPPLVDPALWDRVNECLTENAAKIPYPGRPHAEKHTHVFAGGVLRCASCGAAFQVSRLDKRRKNGFMPSLYVCTSRRTYRACDAVGVSDVVVGPFLFNLVRNIVRASKTLSRVKSGRDAGYLRAWVEVALFAGPAFPPGVSLHPDDYDSLLSALFSRSRAVYRAPLPSDAPASSGDDALRAEAARHARALERLKAAYLYDDGGMTAQEYHAAREGIQKKLDAVSGRLSSSRPSAPDDAAFLASASAFLLAYRLTGDEPVDYPALASAVEPSVLKDFVNTVVSRIDIDGGRVSAVTFKNGLRLRFLYSSQNDV